MLTDSQQQQICKHPLFAQMSATQQAALFKTAVVRQLPTGTVFVKEGELSRNFYYLESGSVQVFTVDQELKPLVLARLEQGSVFGEQGLMSVNKGRRTASVRSLEPISLIIFDGRTLRAIVAQSKTLQRQLTALGNKQKQAKLRAQSLLLKAVRQAHVMEQCQAVSLPAESVIFNQGDTGDGVYFIQSGTIAIYQNDGSSQRLLVRLKSGQSFGELSSLESNARAASAFAETDVSLLKVPGELFDNLLSHNDSLRKMMERLRATYALPGGAFLTQYAGTFEGLPCTTSVYKLADGRLVSGSHVPVLPMYTLSVEGDSATWKTYTHADGQVTTTVMVDQDSTLKSIQIEGYREDLSLLHQTVMNGEKIAEWQLELFKRRGKLYLHVASPSYEGDEIACSCLQLTYNDVVEASQAGMGEDCGAGSICGGCTPRIQELLGHNQWQAVEIIKVEDCSQDYRRLRLLPLGGEVAIHWPGQHLVVQMLDSGHWVERSYTLVSTPGDDYYEILIKRTPGGRLSTRFFNENIHEHLIRVSEPTGNNIINWDKTLQLDCFVAGIGVTPAIALAMALKQRQDLRDRHLRIHYSQRGAEIPLHIDELRKLSQDDRRIEFVLHDTESDGRLSAEQASVWAENRQFGSFYLCGPEPYIDMLEAALLALQVPKSNIKIELFNHASLAPRLFGERVPVDEQECPVNAAAGETDLGSFQPILVEDNADLQVQANAFLQQLYCELDAPDLFKSRWRQVQHEIAEHGTYTHTRDELTYGAKMAWRNSSACIGRQFWQNLNVRDFRDAETTGAIFEGLMGHIKRANNHGKLQPTISIFSPNTPNHAVHTIVNSQLIGYAGYRTSDGEILGDPRNLDITKLALSLGWEPLGHRSAFDLLPIVIRQSDDSYIWRPLPREDVLQIDISHPTYRWFSDLGLRWYAVPIVSSLQLSLGGVYYNNAPFNGWYVDTQVGGSIFTSQERYNMVRPVAQRMGLDTTRERNLWRDRAALEINRAVLYSFERAGITMMDHHEAAKSFLGFENDEQESGREVCVHASAILTTSAGAVGPLYGRSWSDKRLLPALLPRK